MTCVPGTTKISLCIRNDLIEAFEAIEKEDIENGVIPYSMTELVSGGISTFLRWTENQRKEQT